MFDSAEKFIRDNFNAADKIAIAVSGGRDSVCLLHFVVNLNYFDKSNIIAVHINHNLRETAMRDEKHVRAICEAMQVQLLCKSVDVAAICADTGRSVETVAREERLEVFAQLVKRGGVRTVFTAHHALDRAEAVLMHIVRGCSIDGLVGANSGAFTSQPLYETTPAELDDYVKIHNIKYVIDETNFDDKADRNFIRLKVIPLIEQRYPGAVNAINALANDAAECVDALDRGMKSDFLNGDGNAITIDLRAKNDALFSRYVVTAMKLCFQESGLQYDFDRKAVGRVRALFDKKTGARCDVNKNIEAANEGDCVAIYAKYEICKDEIAVRRGAVNIGNARVFIKDASLDAARLGSLMDYDKLKGAVIRFRRDGDRFHSCNGKPKKLKEYFIDNKVPRRVRDKTPLICRGNDVLAIIGMEIGDEVKLTNNTKRAVNVAYEY